MNQHIIPLCTMEAKLLVTEMKALGLSIRSRREELGLTIAQLSASSGTSIRLISELERGKRPGVTFKTLLKVVTLLGWDLELRPRGGAGGVRV